METKATVTDLELLIKTITSQVINNIIKLPMENTELNNLHFPSLKGEHEQMLVLVPDFVIDLGSFLEHLVDKHPGYKLVIVCSGRIQELKVQEIHEILNIEEEASRTKLLKTLNEFSYTYLVMPGIKQIEAIVNGDDTTFLNKLMIYLTLHEKQTGIILDYNIENLPSNNLTIKLSELLNTLKSLGVSIEIIKATSTSEKVIENKKGKRLITERDINELFSRGVNIIKDGNECIITPLAKDRMNELGMKIK